VKRCLAIVLAAALVAAAAVAQAASAATPTVQLTPTGKAVWPDRELVVSLRSGQRVQPSRFRVLENGQPVLGARVLPASAVQGFGAILVIDASLTMRGAPITGAVDAARAFAAHRNVNQRLAVLTFNSSNELVLPFTGSEAKIERALSRAPRLAFGSHVFDATAQAIALIKGARLETGAVVLLSDGSVGDNDVNFAELTRLAQAAHVRVFTVGLRSHFFRPAALKALAAATGGSFSQAANPTELATIYDQLGLKLANQYLLTYRSLVVPGRRVRVSVSVAGLGSAGTAYAAPAPAAISLNRPLSNRVWRSWVTMLVICVLVAGLVGFGLFLVLRPSGSTVRKRLSDFVSTAGQNKEQGREPLTRRIFQGTEHSLEQTRWWVQLKEALELADVKIPPVQLLAGTLVFTLFVIWLLAAVVAPVMGLLGLAVPFVVRGLILYRIEKKRRLFGDQLPDNLDVVASGLRAGHSLVGGLSLVVNDAAEPSQSEFRRVVADEQLGVPLEDALGVVARRMKSRDLEQVALVSSLQRETGSNSAEVLDRVIESIRERAALRRLVRGLTAQGRLSRWVVTFLPVGLLLIFTAVNPTYMRPLFTHASGRVLLAVGVLMVTAGSLVIKKIVDIKV
jgi:tight adherence protein B